MTERRLRCVLGMLASDKHNKGIRILARAFRDHSIEVVYMGEHNTAQQMARVAVAEDADFVGVSFVTGDYVKRTRELVQALRDAGGADIDVLLGGMIHQEDVSLLVDEIGVAGVFGPGSAIPDILVFVDDRFGPEAANTDSGATRLEAT